jgi:hypothetical protein
MRSLLFGDKKLLVLATPAVVSCQTRSAFRDADHFIAHGLKLAIQEIHFAIDWLKNNRPQEAIPFEVGAAAGDAWTPE